MRKIAISNVSLKIMRSLDFWCALVFVVLSVYAEREPKFIGWGIGIVRFENSVCTSVGNLMGTCYTRRQCREVNGVPSATCAQNIGRCCVIYRTCGQTSTYNNTYFTNENFPSTGNTTSCTMTIQKCNNDICQVRLDFLSLSLAQPDPTGVCTTDALQITGGAAPVPIICGENTGQHVYVDFNGNSTIQLVLSTAAARTWNIKVSQIACDCPTRAPIGCLMYYTALSGTVNSFNYGTTANAIDPSRGVPGTRELVNENYGVCVAMVPGYCSIEWSQANNNSFVVSGVPTDDYGPATDGDCTTDFVVIPNPVYPNGTAADSDRFCGTQFNTVRTSSKPFVLTVVTNGDEIGDAMNLGFSLNYRQIPCSTGVNSLTFG